MFKDEENGATNNIYDSWVTILSTPFNHGMGYLVRRLEYIPKEELNHLIWLLQERLKSISTTEHIGELDSEGTPL